MLRSLEGALLVAGQADRQGLANIDVCQYKKRARGAVTPLARWDSSPVLLFVVSAPARVSALCRGSSLSVVQPMDKQRHGDSRQDLRGGSQQKLFHPLSSFRRTVPFARHVLATFSITPTVVGKTLVRELLHI